MADSEIHLPAYSEAGLLFTLDDSGALRTTAAIGNRAWLQANMAKTGAIL